MFSVQNRAKFGIHGSLTILAGLCDAGEANFVTDIFSLFHDCAKTWNPADCAVLVAFQSPCKVYEGELDGAPI